MVIHGNGSLPDQITSNLELYKYTYNSRFVMKSKSKSEISNAKELALKLRIENSYSLQKIANETKLSKSTLSKLLRPYPLDPKLIEQRVHQNQIKGANANKLKAQQNKDNWQNIGYKLIDSCSHFKDLCLLYWGEGTKSYKTKEFRITNADPYMIKFIYNNITTINNQLIISATTYCYDMYTDDEIKQFWNNYLPIDIKVYRCKNSTASKNVRGKSIPYGTMHLRVNNINFFHMVMGGINRLQEAR